MKTVKKLNLEEDYNLFFAAGIVLVLAVKLILMSLFSSDYQDMMFMPFVDCFLSGRNPYEYYLKNNLVSSFPYPPLMLLIESMFGAVALSADNLLIRRLVFKLPLLIFDFIGLYYLSKICYFRRKYILLLYFCSPIILYASYMHGQLDIIPTVLLIMSVYYLTRNISTADFHVAAIFLGCALGTKLHILAAVPIIILYIVKKSGICRALTFTMEITGILAFILAPFWGEGLVRTVLFNKEQTILTNVFIDYGSSRFLIAIVAVTVVCLKAFQLTHMDKKLLLQLMGVMFSMFLVCISPMPGWFIWIIPFVYIYFSEVSENKYKMLAIYVGFNGLYLLYFIFCHRTGYVNLYFQEHSLGFLKLENTSITNIIFSVMAGCLIVIVWNMYQFGIAANGFYRRNSTPFTIGIAGDSGTGKSELLEKIEDTLGKGQILYIEGDGDHRWERGSPDWEEYTHLDPRANYLFRQANDISTLHAGSMVRRVDYDHNTGKFTQRKRIKPKPYIILCGLHSLFLPQTRSALDLKIYMDTDETLRRFWKIRRDTGKRGYSNEQIIEQINKRIPDAKKYIYPQKQYADIVIRYFDSQLTDYFDTSREEVISLEMTLDIAINMDGFIQEFNRAGVRVKQDFSDDIMRQTIMMDGHVLRDRDFNLSGIAERIIPEYQDLFSKNIIWREGVDGILQLVILCVIADKMRES